MGMGGVFGLGLLLGAGLAGWVFLGWSLNTAYHGFKVVGMQGKRVALCDSFSAAYRAMDSKEGNKMRLMVSALRVVSRCCPGFALAQLEVWHLKTRLVFPILSFCLLASIKISLFIPTIPISGSPKLSRFIISGLSLEMPGLPSKDHSHTRQRAAPLRHIQSQPRGSV